MLLGFVEYLGDFAGNIIDNAIPNNSDEPKSSDLIGILIAAAVSADKAKKEAFRRMRGA